MKKRGFTLIEILLVISIIATLIAILLPVFASVRGRGRQLTCVSNLHQLGLGIELYAQDSDDIVPFGGDPGDLNTNEWQTYKSGKFWSAAQQMRPLHEIMEPYITGKDIWHCPSDTGFDNPDFSNSVTLPAYPSSFQVFGTSYGYHTELAFRQETLASMIAYDPHPPYSEHGASEINLLSDEVGNWHGSGSEAEGRFNVLLGDGHVKNVTDAEMDAICNLVLDRPQP